jgi:hypothetical protein
MVTTEVPNAVSLSIESSIDPEFLGKQKKAKKNKNF